MTCALHDFKITDKRSHPSSTGQYCPPRYVDHEDSLGHVIPGHRRSDAIHNTGLSNVSHVASHTLSRSAAIVRDSFKDFFVSCTGEVEQQYRTLIAMHTVIYVCYI